VNTRKDRESGIGRWLWTWGLALVLLVSGVTTALASSTRTVETLDVMADPASCGNVYTGYWALLPIEELEIGCQAPATPAAATVGKAPKTAYQVLPDRYWEYSLAELGDHIGRIIYLDEATDVAAGTAKDTPETRIEVLPDRCWEYRMTELGKHTGKVIWRDEQ
jgi:hypothetical protein